MRCLCLGTCSLPAPSSSRLRSVTPTNPNPCSLTSSGGSKHLPGGGEPGLEGGGGGAGGVGVPLLCRGRCARETAG
eukprot:2346050-Rhodomonas_salina.1